MKILKPVLALAAIITGLYSPAQNVGIGNNNPLEKLHIDSGHIKIGRAVLTGGQANLLKFGDGDFCTLGEALSDDQMVLTASHFLFKSNGGFGGRVAIGGTGGVPAAQLELNGTFRLNDGSQAAGKVLTSDASGMATWQNPAQTNTGFKGIITGAVQNISSGSNTTIIFTGEDYDDASAFFATSYNVPATGLYHFDVMVTWDIAAVGFNTQYTAALTVNGADVHGTVMQVPPSVSGVRTQSFSCDLKLTAGQAVSVYAQHNSGVLQPVLGNSGTTRFTYFSGRRVY